MGAMLDSSRWGGGGGIDRQLVGWASGQARQRFGDRHNFVSRPMCSITARSGRITAIVLGEAGTFNVPPIDADIYVHVAIEHRANRLRTYIVCHWER